MLTPIPVGAKDSAIRCGTVWPFGNEAAHSCRKLRISAQATMRIDLGPRNDIKDVEASSLLDIGQHLEGLHVFHLV